MSTSDMAADIHTKPILGTRFSKLRRMLGVVQLPQSLVSSQGCVEDCTDVHDDDDYDDSNWTTVERSQHRQVAVTTADVNPLVHINNRFDVLPLDEEE